MGWPRLTFTLALRSVTSPSLARDLFRVMWRFRPRRWYLRPPFLPVPSREYMRWRMYTVYGDEHATPPVNDIVRYARWAAKQKP